MSMPTPINHCLIQEGYSCEKDMEKTTLGNATAVIVLSTGLPSWLFLF